MCTNDAVDIILYTLYENCTLSQNMKDKTHKNQMLKYTFELQSLLKKIIY